MKCKTVYGCLTPQLCGHARECIEGPSERASPEPAGTVPVVAAVSTGSLPVSSAEALAMNWEDRAKGLQLQAATTNSAELKGRLTCASDVFWLCARQLRRQMEAANERQPEENHRISQTEKHE